MSVEISARRVRPIPEGSVTAFGATVSDTAAVAAALGLATDDLSDASRPQVVSTGAGHLLIEAVSREAVDRIRIDTGGPRIRIVGQGLVVADAAARHLLTSAAVIVTNLCILIALRKLVTIHSKAERMQRNEHSRIRNH